VLLSFGGARPGGHLPVDQSGSSRDPQAYLGILRFGIPMGYAAVLDDLPPEMWWLLLANIFLGHRLRYRVRDGSIARTTCASASGPQPFTLGRYDVAAVMFCYGVTSSCSPESGCITEWVCSTTRGWRAPAALMAYHYRLIRGRDREACFKGLQPEQLVGAVIFGGMFLDFTARRGMPWA